MEDSKTCGRCKQAQSKSNFSKASREKDGLQQWCKSCWLEYRAKTREARAARDAAYHAKNRDRILARMREYHRGRIDEAKAYRRKNADHISAYNAKYHAEHVDEILPRKRKYAQEFPDMRRAREERRRARKMQAGIFLVTAKDIARLLKQPCLYCGKKAEHIDHVIPLARGGRHSIGNLAPACAKCNQTKHSKFIMEWERQKKAPR